MALNGKFYQPTLQEEIINSIVFMFVKLILIEKVILFDKSRGMGSTHLVI